MTAKCANPACSQQFLYFRTGRIFLIEIAPTPGSTDSRRGPKYYWLCGDCSRTMKVVLDRTGSVAIQHQETAATTAA